MKRKPETIETRLVRRLPDDVRNLLNAGSGRHNPITLPRISIQDDDEERTPRSVTLWPAGQAEDGD